MRLTGEAQQEDSRPKSVGHAGDDGHPELSLQRSDQF